MNSGTKIELLAPAGSLEVFEAAVENGADAVYVGAPFLNARALARHFSRAELAAMVSHGHKAGVKVYAAMNSLVKEAEIEQAVETIAFLESISIDALIIQDLGLYHILKNYFPGIRLHASTLMTAHNSMGVRQLEQMGFDRVVLARELTLAEIAEIRVKTRVELETFVHGAMCFSYSGQCLFSSYLGGKSGLRGRCVQPCRRRYTFTGQGKVDRSGYLFSMNDLSGMEMIPELREAGVGSLKIEGRMRSVQYVANVIQAFRIALDADPEDQEAMTRARELLAGDLGRRPFQGYFASANPADAISAGHSGNTGLFLGQIEHSRGKNVGLVLREAITNGDRLRLHLEKSGDRHAFTLNRLLDQFGKPVDNGAAGEKVTITLPVSAAAGDSLYKVDFKARRQNVTRPKIKAANFERIARELARPEFVGEIMARINKFDRRKPLVKALSNKMRQMPRGRSRRGSEDHQSLELWVKIDDPGLLRRQLPIVPVRYLMILDRQSAASHMKIPNALRRKIIFGLPPVIDEADLLFYQESVNSLIGRGYVEWQIAHVGQLGFFPAQGILGRDSHGRANRVRFYGDHSLNVTNSLTVTALAKLGLSHVQLSLENDRDNIMGVCARTGSIRNGLTIYGRPPLFTARPIDGHFLYGTVFVSPRGEPFELVKRYGKTVVLPKDPFSLLPFAAELSQFGLHYGVIDLTGRRWNRNELTAVFSSSPSRGREGRLSTFNYRGELL